MNHKKLGLNEGDIQMVAEALIVMFGDEAMARATGRVEEYQKNSDGEKFWLDVSEAISTQLKERNH